MHTNVTLLKEGADPSETFVFGRHFSYRPVSPKKRITTSDTCGGTVIQESSECPVVTGSLIPWTYIACPTEWKMLQDLYRDCDGGSAHFEFDGYWEDQYLVKILHIDDPPVKGRRFEVSGSFLVLCEIADADPEDGWTPDP